MPRIASYRQMVHDARHVAVAAGSIVDRVGRVAQLESSGYRRVFSMVELERGTAAMVTPSVPGSITAATVADADAMHQLTTVVWAGRTFFRCRLWSRTAAGCETPILD